MGQLALFPVPTEIVALVRRVVNTMGVPAWRQGKVQMVLETAHAEAWAIADEQRLVQVLVSLLHNVVHHTLPGGVVVVNVESRSDAVIIQMQNTGGGVHLDALPDSWEQSHRRQKQSHRRQKWIKEGPGLSMARMKDLIEAMGGTFTIENILEEEKGDEMIKQKTVFLIGLMIVLTLACVSTPTIEMPGGSTTKMPVNPVETVTGSTPVAAATETGGTQVPRPSSGSLIQPSDMTYLGAFRLPGDAPDDVGWKWSGEALAYYPDGDSRGPDDGFPGSLFGTGHNWNQHVSEVSIPVPVVSSGKNPEDLNTASTLQPFRDVRGGTLDWPMEQARTGLEVLPPQGEQESSKLYFCSAPHLDEGATNPSHGWIDVDLSASQPAGAWRVGEYVNYVTTDYMFAIPQEWADAYVPGMRLATGRYRDGGQASFGPSLFAIGPWNEGNPPQPGATINAVPLLLYGNVYEEGSPAMDNYAHSDHWSGGAWLTAGDKSAVVFVGTKGLGELWYGCSDGTVWPEDPPYPPECDDRGWWSERFAAQITFYDPADLAAVATGAMESGEPQPYTVLEIEDVLYSTNFVLLGHLGAAAFDRERGLLYVIEPLVDDERSIVHVWRVEN